MIKWYSNSLEPNFIIKGFLMKKSGFTMIELIFVIVILGILAAVALPKFIGVSEQAEAGKVDAFVGTLNRTVGPTLWSKSVAKGDSGSVKGANYCGDIATYTDVPDTVSMDDQCVLTFTGTSYGTFAFTDGTKTQSPKWTFTPN